MSELRFDDRVVVVTGAGNGLGRAHARLFAERGAKVVVNDLGGTLQGEGQSMTAADRVVDELRAAGGEAVANHDSVENGGRIIESALDHFGRIDVVINNAGILRDSSFHKMSGDHWDAVYRVHVVGAFRVTHAAWPHLRNQGYGRIVMTSSAAGLYGNFGQANYAMAKLGLLGFANTLAVEGQSKGIHVNTVAPVAGSRMTEAILPPELLENLKPEYVSPLVAWLAHEDCPANGEVFEVGGGFFARLKVARSRGASFRIGQRITPDVLRSQWSTITQLDDITYPDSVMVALAPIVENIQRGPEPESDLAESDLAESDLAKSDLAESDLAESDLAHASPQTEAAASPNADASPDAPSDAAHAALACDVFAAIDDYVRAESETMNRIGQVFVFQLTDPVSAWTIDLKSTPPEVRPGATDKPDCTLTLSDADFMAMSSGQADPQKLFMAQKLRISGNVLASQKLTFLQKIPVEAVEAAAFARGGRPTPAAAAEPAVDEAPSAHPPSVGPRLFAALAERIKSHPELTASLSGKLQFVISDRDEVWVVDLRGPEKTVSDGPAPDPDTTLTLTEDALMALVRGATSAQQLYQRGEMRIDGDVRAAHHLSFMKALALEESK